MSDRVLGAGLIVAIAVMAWWLARGVSPLSNAMPREQPQVTPSAPLDAGPRASNTLREATAQSTSPTARADAGVSPVQRAQTGPRREDVEASIAEAVRAIDDFEASVADHRRLLLEHGTPEPIADALTQSFAIQNATLRITQLEAGDPSWPLRVEEYRVARDELWRAVPPTDRAAAARALRERTFEPVDWARARAWEAIDARLHPEEAPDPR